MFVTMWYKLTFSVHYAGRRVERRCPLVLTPKRLWYTFVYKGPRSIVAFRHATPMRCAARLRRTRHSTARVESFPPLPLRPPAAKYKVCTVLLKSDLDFRKLLRRRAL